MPTSTAISVWGMNSCGVAQNSPYTISFGTKTSGCTVFFSVSPNPTSSSITISPDESDVSALNKIAETKPIDRIRIYNQQSTMLKDQKFGKVQTATLDVSGLTPGNYTVEIISGTYSEQQIIIIQ